MKTLKVSKAIPREPINPAVSEKRLKLAVKSSQMINRDEAVIMTRVIDHIV
jgi:hypothetical protein